MSERSSQAIAKVTVDDSELATTDPGRNAKVFTENLGGYTLARMLGLPDEDLVPSGQAMIDQVLEGVGVRDPLERMLIEQLTWTYQRVQGLSLLAAEALDPALRLSANQQCDKTMNAYRRGMLALKEYRGAKQRTPYVAIQQVNESEPGNVVVSPRSGSSLGKKKLPNEQEADGGD